MEHISFEGVNLAELLPRIPDSIKDDLPFGLVKLDLTGKILEYNMAEGDLTGVSPDWALGKNFFDEVAMCTKTAAFYGRFVEGVKKGFINAVFDYTFDHRDVATQVKVHMVTVPDHMGRKNVMILVKRANRPRVQDAVDYTLPANADSPDAVAATQTVAVTEQTANAAPSIQDIVTAVMTAMQQTGTPTDINSVAKAVVSTMQNKGSAALAAAAVIPAPVTPAAPTPRRLSGPPRSQPLPKSRSLRM